MNTTRCPCLSGQTYDECCGRLHRGELRASTAEILMRSRFSAFAVGDADYLRRTWHPTTRPPELVLDDDVRWYRLDVLAKSDGGRLDATGTVEFRAFFRASSGAGSQHEVSRFVCADGQWLYLDAIG
ncbi:MAG: YchJ family protein [Cellulomonas sp.]|nr:YchJ family protein [Cellulomonas sp.]